MLFIKVMLQTMISMKIFELLWKLAPFLIALLVWAFLPSTWKIGILLALVAWVGTRYWYRRRQMFWPRWQRLLFVAALTVALLLVFRFFGGLSAAVAITAFAFAFVAVGIWLYGQPSPVLKDREIERLRRTLLSPRIINDAFYDVGLKRSLDAKKRWSTRRKGSPLARFLGKDGSSTQAGHEIVVSRSTRGRMTVGGTRYEVPKVKAIQEINAGLRTTLTKVGALTYGDYVAIAPNLESSLGLHKVKIKETTADRANKTISVSLLIRDPLNATIPYTEDPKVLISPDTPWHVGADEEGEPIRYDVAGGAHLGLYGTTRTGKSVCTYSLITHLLRMGESVRLLVCDPNDTTVGPFEPVLSWSTNDPTPVKPTAMLRWMRAEMIRRQPILRRLETDKVTTFSPELPLIVAIIDEAANYMRSSDSKAASEFNNELLAVVSQGAKYGIRLVIIAQRPDSTILPTSIRSQISARISFRVEDIQTATMAFPELENKTELLGFEPGVGLFREVGGQPRKFRSLYLKDHYGIAREIKPVPRVDINDLDTNPRPEGPIDIGEMVVVRADAPPEPNTHDDPSVTDDEVVIDPEPETQETDSGPEAPTQEGAEPTQRTSTTTKTAPEPQQDPEQRKRSILDEMEDFEN